MLAINFANLVLTSRPLSYSVDVKDTSPAIHAPGERFSARRMLEEYVEKYYVPSMTDSVTPDDPPTR